MTKKFSTVLAATAKSAVVATVAAALLVSGSLTTGAAAPAGVTDSGTRTPVHYYSTRQQNIVPLAIDCCSGALTVDNAAITLPVLDGDMLNVEAFTELANDAPAPRYTVGVGYHIYAERTGMPATRIEIGPWVGLNIGEPTPRTHYAEVVNATTWFVPEGWAGDVTITTNVDAMSTAWRPNEFLTIRDNYGRVSVEVWRD
jgi:hypothetical protein